jgi:hypothetical protein
MEHSVAPIIFPADDLAWEDLHPITQRRLHAQLDVGGTVSSSKILHGRRRASL